MRIKFLNTIIENDARKNVWEISRSTEIRVLTEPVISEITTFVNSMVDEAGILA